MGLGCRSFKNCFFVDFAVPRTLRAREAGYETNSVCRQIDSQDGTRRQMGAFSY